MTSTQDPEIFPVRVWFHPVKLWEATANKDKAEAEALMETICSLIERREFAALERYDFIRIGSYGDVHWS